MGNLMLLASNFDAKTFYDVMMWIMMGLMVLLSIGMIVVVLLQQGTNSNLGAITGGGDSFFGKNKARTLDHKLKIVTVSFASGLMVCSILFFVFYILQQNIG